MAVNPAWSRIYNNPAPHLAQFETYKQGRVSVVNGELFFSPNAKRELEAEGIHATPVVFHPSVSSLADFQYPRIWSLETEWLGMLPKSPVPWTGITFECLSLLPRWFVGSKKTDYMLYRRTANEWQSIETVLCKCVDTILTKIPYSINKPFPPSTFGYSATYTSEETTRIQSLKARDWFAVWVGLFYWLTCKHSDMEQKEGVDVPVWYTDILVAMKRDGALNVATGIATDKSISRIILDGIRTSPLLQRGWDMDRVGLILRTDSIPSQQPSASWFMYWNIPVWYRCGPQEQDMKKRGVLHWPMPSPKQLQEATTWINKAPSPRYRANESVSWTPQSPAFVQADFEPLLLPQSPSSPGTSSNPVGNESLVQKEVQDVGGPSKRKDGREFWEPFFQKRERYWEKKKAQESPKERQMRENRERNPPTSSCPVYVWEWDEGNVKMVRRLVSRKDRSSTLDEYGPLQKRYDPFLNEWNCCKDWGPDRDDDDQSNYGDDAYQPPIEFESPEGDLVKLIHQHFGFVHPIPIPLSTEKGLEMPEKRGFISLLGLTKMNLDDPWFLQPIGHLCTRFLWNFLAANPRQPIAEEWDLSEKSRTSLIVSYRLRIIRRVTNSNLSMYLFDSRNGSSLPWKIAVYTATAALHICRLDLNMDERDIALYLAWKGIPFRTLQRKDSLGHADGQNNLMDSCSLREQDHEFTSADYDCYQRQFQALLTTPRGRAALLRGGFIWRISSTLISKDEVLKGPSGRHSNPRHMFSVKDKDGVEYIDDELTPEELDMLSGNYIRFTGYGKQTSKVSWWPLVHLYEGSGEDRGWWTGRAEELFNKRERAILEGTGARQSRIPLSPAEWRTKMRGFKDVQRAVKQCETWSSKFLLAEADL